MKNFVKYIISLLIKCLNKTSLGDYISRSLLANAMNKTKSVFHGDLNLKFVIPNKLCSWRAETFSSKEPETLEWIDSFDENSIFWDIGANVGTYSIYAGLKKKSNVWAFEPSVFNLEVLARNIYVNKLEKKINIVPIAVSESSGLSLMKMTTTQWGGALSTFGEDKLGWDGKEVDEIFSYNTIGFSMDMAVSFLKIPSPDYLKIDVDGTEHFILSGGLDVFKSIKSILIEVNDDFHAQAEKCEDILTAAGFVMTQKRHSDEIASNKQGYQNTYNQIWQKK